MRFVICMALCLLLLSICFPALSEEAVEWEIGGDIPFTMLTLEDWVDIPYDELDALAEEAASAQPGAEPVSYSAGVQPKSKEWMSDVYVLIATKHYPRGFEMTERKIERFRRGMFKGISESIGKAKAGKGMSAISANIGEYDPAHHIQFIDFDLDIQGKGKLHVLQGVKFARTGVIMINCYAKASDYEKHVDMFKWIARSVQVDAAQEVKPGSATEQSEAYRFGQIMGRFLCMLTFLGLIIMGISRLVKNARKGSAKSAEQ